MTRAVQAFTQPGPRGTGSRSAYTEPSASQSEMMGQARAAHASSTVQLKPSDHVVVSHG